ncbi:MAG: hypothetical protein OXE86_04255 [Alphaproteobacteria bacterium]|nr:hypothetical protein [Alphaproteobacteria bacterium]
MARLRDAKPKNTSGSYERIFGNAELGALASKIQSAVITSGSELEAMIVAAVPNIPDLDAFLEQEIMQEGVLLAPKIQIKRSTTLDFAGSEPDFMVFKRRGSVQTCHIVELKDGHVFDTKKASAERQAMHRFIERNAQHIQYRFRAHFCAFNQDDRQAIWNGFKRRIALDEAMTGREFCDLLEIDYDSIVEARRADGPDNVEFLLSEMLNIELIRRRILEILG